MLFVRTVCTRTWHAHVQLQGRRVVKMMPRISMQQQEQDGNDNLTNIILYASHSTAALD
jgi:hypothetical protein